MGEGKRNFQSSQSINQNTRQNNNQHNIRNQQKFNQRKTNSKNNNRVKESNFVSPTGSESTSHSPTSSSGLTIEEFLTRYPEVKRLSSRFGDDVPNTESPFKSHKKHNKGHKKKNNKKQKNRPHNNAPNNNAANSVAEVHQQQTSFTAFSAPETTPATKPPRITPRQRQ